MKEALEMTWIDYTVFIFMLILSTGFGLYHGVMKNKSNTIEEYLFAGRKIPAIPLILSNMASTVSSIAIVGISRETYYYGLQIIFLPLGQLTGFALFYFFYIPVFYDLKYTSYFERFNQAIRLLGSTVFIICQIIYAVLIMYSSCTAVTKVIPVPFYLLTTTLCCLCTVYTFLGGLRGVVWSDFIQALFMYGSIITIIIISIQNVGGVNRVIDIANEGGRLQFFNFDPSPFTRYSSWLLWIAGLTLSLQYVCTNPGVIQRCLSISTYKKVKIIIISSAAAHFAVFSSSAIIGLLIYTTYYNCDPILSKDLDDADQLVTYHVLKIGRHLPGLSGLFLAGILSASLRLFASLSYIFILNMWMGPLCWIISGILYVVACIFILFLTGFGFKSIVRANSPSSLSTIMNTLSGIIFEDFVKTFTPFTLNNTRTNLCLKSIVVLIGLIVSGGIFTLNPSAGLFQLSTTMSSLCGGLIIFIVSFGLFIRNANTKGVIIGTLSGISVTLWIILGNMWAVASGKVKYTTKIISIEGCIGNLSLTFENITRGSPYDTSVRFDDDVPYPYRISFNLFSAIGIIVSFVVGILIVLCTKHNKSLDENLLIPQIRRKIEDYVTDTES